MMRRAFCCSADAGYPVCVVLCENLILASPARPEKSGRGLPAAL